MGRKGSITVALVVAVTVIGVVRWERRPIPVGRTKLRRHDVGPRVA